MGSSIRVPVPTALQVPLVDLVQTEKPEVCGYQESLSTFTPVCVRVRPGQFSVCHRPCWSVSHWTRCPGKVGDASTLEDALHQSLGKRTPRTTHPACSAHLSCIRDVTDMRARSPREPSGQPDARLEVVRFETQRLEDARRLSSREPQTFCHILKTYPSFTVDTNVKQDEFYHHTLLFLDGFTTAASSAAALHETGDATSADWCRDAMRDAHAR